jgi:hypothetical protein
MTETLQKAVLMRRVTDIKYSKLSTWRIWKKKFKVIDMFGSQIMFTHKYKDTFKTMEGAILTLLIYIALTVVAGIYMQNMVRRTEQIINSQTEFIDLSNDIKPFVFESGSSNIENLNTQSSNYLASFF